MSAGSRGWSAAPRGPRRRGSRAGGGGARAAGAAVSVDVAAANRIAAFGATAYADLLRKLGPDLLFCNAREAEVLGDVGWLARLVVVHAGPAPTRILAGGGELQVGVPPA